MAQRLYAVKTVNGSATLLTNFLSEVNFLHRSKLDVLLLAARIFLIHKWNFHKQIWEQTQLPLGKKTSELVGKTMLVFTSNPVVASVKVCHRHQRICFVGEKSLAFSGVSDMRELINKVSTV